MPLITGATVFYGIKFVTSNFVAPWIATKGWQHRFDIAKTVQSLRDDLEQFTNKSRVTTLVRELTGTLSLPQLVALAKELEEERAALRLEAGRDRADIARITGELEQLIARATLTAGKTLLERRVTRHDDQSTRLSQRYLGLYLLGLAGGQIVTEQKRSTILFDLVMWHQQQSSRVAAAAAQQLSCFFPENSGAIIAALQKVPEVSELDRGTPFADQAELIVYALGGKNDGDLHDQSSLLIELPERFPLTKATVAGN